MTIINTSGHHDLSLIHVDTNGCPFKSNQEYLEALLALQRRRLELYRGASLEFEAKDGITPSHKSFIIELQSFTKRVMASRSAGCLPPLENLRDKFDLSDHDMEIIRLLFCLQTDWQLNRKFCNMYEHRDITVGSINECLSISHHDRIEYFKRFDSKAPLFSSMLLVINGRRGSSLLHGEIHLPARIIDHAIGEDCRFNEVQDFITEIKPTTNMDQVLLNGNLRDEILHLVASFPKMAKKADSLGLTELLGFGGGLALLFHGPSGTGKTMMARAIARHVNKPLLALNMENDEYSGRHISGEAICILYREAHLRDGIVFFDECDDLFQEGSHQSSILLQEIEKLPVITIFTTNAPAVLDPALSRRIMRKVHFEMPDASLRRRLWEIHVPKAVVLAPDVDLDTLSLKYRISGGQIRNAVQMATSLAFESSDCDSIILNQTRLEESVRHQARCMTEKNDPSDKPENHDAFNIELQFNQSEQSKISHIKSILQTYTANGVVRQPHFDGIENKGLKILLSSPSFMRGMKILSEITKDLPLKLYKRDVNVIFNEVEFQKSSRTEREERMIPSVFDLMVYSTSLLIISDPKGIISMVKEERDERWATLESRLMGITDPVVYVTTGRVIPHEIFRHWFHYRLFFNGENAFEKLQIWQACLQGCTNDELLVKSTFSLVEQLPRDVFLRLTKIIRYEAASHSNDLSQSNVIEIIKRLRHETAGTETLFGSITNSNDEIDE